MPALEEVNALVDPRFENISVCGGGKYTNAIVKLGFRLGVSVMMMSMSDWYVISRKRISLSSAIATPPYQTFLDFVKKLYPDM